MNIMTIWVNVLLEYRYDTRNPQIERVLWIGPLGHDIVTIDVNRQNKHALPVWKAYKEIESALEAGDIHMVDSDPWASLLHPDEKFLEKHGKHRDEAWEAIRMIVESKSILQFDPYQRGSLITALSKEKGKSKGFIYDALRRYWQGGQTKNALLPYYQKCGAKGKEREGKEHKLGRPSALARKGEVPAGVILTNDVRSKLLRGYKKYYVSGKEKTLDKAHQRTLETFFNIGFDQKDGDAIVPLLPPAEQLPTFEQFRYVHEKYDDVTSVLTSREGERRFPLRHREILGESTHMAVGPGSLYQGDSTIGDLHLVSSRDRSRLIGRPVIYVIIDVFTRMIVGFSVSLEGPSWLGMMQALENATLDKVAFCKEYGIDITEDEWPCQYLPEEILGDRGELEGKQSTNLGDCLDVRLSQNPPYRCDWKGIVEQNFRLINNEVIHWRPGAVYEKRERGDKDYRLEACLTLPEFRQVMIHCIIKHNNHHRMNWYNMDEFAITDHVEPYPIDLWSWGIRKRFGHLRKKPSEVVKLNLLPPDTASVTEYGIYFKGVYYTCDLAIREQWFVKARVKGRWPVSIVYDPRHLDVIYLHLHHGSDLELCTLVERDKPRYQGRDWFEILDYFELQKQAEETSHTRHYRVEAEFNATIDSIIANAQEQTKQVTKGMSKSARLRNIHDNRRSERNEERARDAWHLREKGTLVPPTQREAEEDQIEEPETYVPPDQSLDDIRRLRQEKWAKLQINGEKTNE